MVITVISVLAIFVTIEQMEQIEADVQENIDSSILNSSILGEQRKLLVHLPSEYDSSQTYPVMYVLDGSSQDYRIAGILEILNRAEIVQDMIIVGIPNTDRNRDLTPHYIFQDTDGETLGKGDEFLSFLTNEVIPFIESNYSVNQYRMLAGHSRAGLFTYYAYLEQPETFDALFCFSPAFWRDNSIILGKAQEFYTSTRNENPFIFMSLGTEENEKMMRAYNAMTNLLDANMIKNVVHTFTPKANHGNNLYYSTPIALKKWADQVHNNR